MGGIDENTITQHAISISLLTDAVSSIKDSMKQQTESIKEIEKAMKSQELLLEKVANLDSRITDSVNRLHKRIDTVETAVDRMKIEYETTCDVVRPMAHKGAFVHGLLVKAAVGLAIVAAGSIGTLIIWAIKQGGLDG